MTLALITNIASAILQASEEGLDLKSRIKIVWLGGGPELYPNNKLGEYLKAITPARQKALFDIATISMVIGNHLEKPWLKSMEPSVVLGPEQQYRWKKVDSPANVFIIWEIDAKAMKADFFNTLNGKPTALPPKQEKR